MPGFFVEHPLGVTLHTEPEATVTHQCPKCDVTFTGPVRDVLEQYRDHVLDTHMDALEDECGCCGGCGQVPPVPPPTTTTTPVTHISWAASRSGYTVRVLNVNETVAEYNGGNCPGDSVAVLSPDDPHAVPVATLRKYAKQTALEMAEEYGLPKRMVAEDTDLLEEEE